MGVGSGLGGQLGFAKETTYGTFVAPSKFYEFDGDSGDGLRLITVDGGGIAAGRAARLVSQRVVAGREAAKTFPMSVPIVGFGLILQQIFGTTVTPVQQGGTPAYLQTHALVSDLTGKSLTAQVGVPSTDGTVNPYTYLGGKITKADFSCTKDDLLKASLEMDFRDVTEAQSLATASYPTTAAPFNFTQMKVKIGTTVAGAANADGVDNFSLSIERRMKTDRRYANSGGLKGEPITNDFVGASGSIGADFVTKTAFADRWAADTSFALVWQFTGAVISGAYSYDLTFEIPSCKFTGSTPGVSSVDVVNGSFPFTVYSNGTDPIVTAKLVTTDITL